MLSKLCVLWVVGFGVYYLTTYFIKGNEVEEFTGMKLVYFIFIAALLSIAAVFVMKEVGLLDEDEGLHALFVFAVAQTMRMAKWMALHERD